MPGSSGSVIIVISLKAKYRFHAATVHLLRSIKVTVTKVPYSSKVRP
jgi:hypothetical protein